MIDALASALVDKTMDVLRTTALIVGVSIAVWTFYRNTIATKVSNLFLITSSHREIWSKSLDDEEVQKCLDTAFNSENITFKQKRFIHFIILHFASCYKAQKMGSLFVEEQLRLDAHSFFNLPGPKYVWRQCEHLQNKAFKRFVNNCIDSPDPFLIRTIKKLKHRFTSSTFGRL